jgi:hypothetical protein
MYILFTTDASRRGVFFAEVEDTTDLKEAVKTGIIQCKMIRNVIKWQATGGVFGLAENGPNDKCRIGEAAKVTSFWNGVTFVSHVSKKATKAFLEAPTYVAH